MNQQPYNIVVGDAFAMVCNFSINILRVLFVALNTALISKLEGYQRVYNFIFLHFKEQISILNMKLFVVSCDLIILKMIV